MGGRAVCLIAALVMAPLPCAHAQGSTPGLQAPCSYNIAGAGTVSAVVDGRSFVLDDGRAVRLADVEVPLAPLPGETGPRAAAGTAARAALTSIVAGRRVELRARELSTDRYGRAVAHVVVAGDGAEQDVAEKMLADGYARVTAQTGDRPCAARLLALEHAARNAKLGLWREPYYGIVGAQSRAELLAQRGRFTLVEGKVLSVRESGATIYMNFGRRWSDALTVTVWKRNERTFVAAGLPPKSLENRHIRVRGWVEERNGPRIEASRPEQIEIAERN
jgi:endonuclease YncB( thermonuclease family)